MRNVIFTVVFVLFAVIFVSCGGDELGASNCSDEEPCPNIDGTYIFCCNSTLSDCYYEAGSEKFGCDGESCSEAAQKLYDYCNAEGSIEE